jgi:hypothetical protein
MPPKATPPSRPTPADVALLVILQVATSALGILILELLSIKGPSSGFAAVGTLLGAQTFASIAQNKSPDAFDARAWRRLALYAAACHLVLGVGALLAIGLPALTSLSPWILLIIIVVVGGPLAFGVTLAGLRLGARASRKQAAAKLADGAPGSERVQVAGAACVQCAEKIVFADNGLACLKCGQPMHKKCKGAHECRTRKRS